jgi:putative transposase
LKSKLGFGHISGGIARKHKMTAIQIGGVDDHIHALILAPPIVAPSQIAQYLKGDASKMDS